MIGRLMSLLRGREIRLPMPTFRDSVQAVVPQAPRYDLIDPDGRNQHFHLIDREEAIDHAVDPDAFPLHPDHLCRRHFAENERLTGMQNLADCREGGYHVEVDNGCHWGCDRCRAEMHAYARHASRVLQEDYGHY